MSTTGADGAGPGGGDDKPGGDNGKVLVLEPAADQQQVVDEQERNATGNKAGGGGANDGGANDNTTPLIHKSSISLQKPDPNKSSAYNPPPVPQRGSTRTLNSTEAKAKVTTYLEGLLAPPRELKYASQPNDRRHFTTLKSCHEHEALRQFLLYLPLFEKKAPTERNLQIGIERLFWEARRDNTTRLQLLNIYYYWIRFYGDWDFEPENREPDRQGLASRKQTRAFLEAADADLNERIGMQRLPAFTSHGARTPSASGSQVLRSSQTSLVTDDTSPVPSEHSIQALLQVIVKIRSFIAGQEINPDHFTEHGLPSPEIGSCQRNDALLSALNGQHHARGSPFAKQKPTQRISVTQTVNSQNATMRTADTEATSPLGQRRLSRRAERIAEGMSAMIDPENDSIEDVAAQMTHLGFAIYRQIHPRELINTNWLRKENDAELRLHPGVTDYTAYHEGITFWAVDFIHDAEDLQQRTERLKYLVKLGRILHEINNFMACDAIVCALEKNEVHNLKDLWRRTNFDKHMQFYERVLTKTYKFTQNYKPLRILMNKLRASSGEDRKRTPCVPFLPAFISIQKLFKFDGKIAETQGTAAETQDATERKRKGGYQIMQEFFAWQGCRYDKFSMKKGGNRAAVNLVSQSDKTRTLQSRIANIIHEMRQEDNRMRDTETYSWFQQRKKEDNEEGHNWYGGCGMCSAKCGLVLDLCVFTTIIALHCYVLFFWFQYGFDTDQWIGPYRRADELGILHMLPKGWIPHHGVDHGCLTEDHQNYTAHWAFRNYHNQTMASEKCLHDGEPLPDDRWSFYSDEGVGSVTPASVTRPKEYPTSRYARDFVFTWAIAMAAGNIVQMWVIWKTFYQEKKKPGSSFKGKCLDIFLAAIGLGIPHAVVKAWGPERVEELSKVQRRDPLQLMRLLNIEFNIKYDSWDMAYEWNRLWTSWLVFYLFPMGIVHIFAYSVVYAVGEPCGPNTGSGMHSSIPFFASLGISCLVVSFGVIRMFEGINSSIFRYTKCKCGFRFIMVLIITSGIGVRMGSLVVLGMASRILALEDKELGLIPYTNIDAEDLVVINPEVNPDGSQTIDDKLTCVMWGFERECLVAVKGKVDPPVQDLRTPLLMWCPGRQVWGYLAGFCFFVFELVYSTWESCALRKQLKRESEENDHVVEKARNGCFWQSMITVLRAVSFLFSDMAAWIMDEKYRLRYFNYEFWMRWFLSGGFMAYVLYYQWEATFDVNGQPCKPRFKYLTWMVHDEPPENFLSIECGKPYRWTIGLGFFFVLNAFSYFVYRWFMTKQDFYEMDVFRGEPSPLAEYSRTDTSTPGLLRRETMVPKTPPANTPPERGQGQEADTDEKAPALEMVTIQQSEG